MGHSLLMIPVPQLDWLVRPRLERVSTELVSGDPRQPLAHITLLSPFAERRAVDEGILSELRSFFADVTAFPFRLGEICQFPSGLVYLAPEPAAPFRQLTHQLYRRFPEYPPYEGQFDEVVPHLSIPAPQGEDVDTLQFELGPRLPITALAREACLVWWEPGGSETLETFRFGVTAA